MSHLLWKPGKQEFQSPVDQILYNRGVKIGEAEAFLEADSRLLYPYFLLPNIYKAVSRVYRALLKGERIAVYGDFDADGITATAILTEGLRLLGADVIAYIPHRLEGHGLNIKALENLFQQGVGLVITADCGTSSSKEIRRIQSRGIDVVITDHHSCIKEPPPALAVVNPGLPSFHYPFPHLSGAGVAYKFILALLEGMGREPEGMLELVALGTITDVVPLTGENRYLVKEGLKQLNRSQRPGIKELIDVAGLKMGEIDAHDVAWILGPRLNAAGRIEHAYLSYHLLLTKSSQEARGLAEKLEERNAERRRLLDKLLNLAREMASGQKEEMLLFISGQEFEVGVAGLVAGKLVDEFYRPAVVVNVQGDLIRGSMRSISDFDLMDALNSCSHFLSNFGGHPAAAGFSAPAENLEKIRQNLQEKAAQLLDPSELRPQVRVDAILPLHRIDSNFIHFCRKLPPLGIGNPPPTLLALREKLGDVRLLGEHLRLKFKDERGMVWDGIGFGLGDHYPLLSPRIDIVYQLKIDSQSSLELNILDLRPS